LARIADFSISDIPLEDGWRLLLNRVIEQLEALEGLEQRPKVLPRPLRYRTIKLYLDMATSFLLFVGEYAPSYLERARRLRTLANKHSINNGFPFDLRHFCDRVSECTCWKLLTPSPHNSASTAMESDANFSWWEEAVTYAELLWRWELALLTQSSRRTSDQELLKSWMRCQPTTKRLRGWLYVLRNQGWHRSWRNWPRWMRLAWCASPRYWIYGAASELLFGLPGLLNDTNGRRHAGVSWENLRSSLPVLPGPERRQKLPEWRELAASIAWNYHEFLVGTRS
jgi:hypothetical protein